MLTLRSNRRLLLRILVAAVLLAVTSLLISGDLGTRLFSPRSRPEHVKSESDQLGGQATTSHAALIESTVQTPLLGDGPQKDGSQQQAGQEEDEAFRTSTPYDLSDIPEQMRTKVTSYVRTILDPYDSTFTGLRCPRVNSKRYDHLKVPQGEKRLPYFFALDLRQVVDLLPRLLGSIVEAMRFLGPKNCALSIIEGNSDDGTWEVLSVLQPELESLGVSSFFLKEQIDPSKDDRIGNLARLRSLALEPLRNSRNSTARSLGLLGSTSKFTDDASVIFLNDVAACPEDILPKIDPVKQFVNAVLLFLKDRPDPLVSPVELLHQRVIQAADMTCAMDWHHPGGKNGKPLFYDVWISRALSGDLFFDIPTNGSWDNAETLFPFDPEASIRLAHHRPFQVFACWNGAVTFTAKPILDGQIDFRRVYEGECFQGEPNTFCKDMWFHGYGRIAVVPSVNLEYTDEKGAWIKEEKGFVYQWAAEEEDEAEGAPPLKIEWQGPPDMVKCMPEFHRQDWVPWNESLV